MDNIDYLNEFDIDRFKEEFFDKKRPFIFSFKSSLSSLDQLTTIIKNESITLRTGDFGHPKEYAQRRETDSEDFRLYLEKLLSGETENYAGNVEIDWEDFFKVIKELPFGNKSSFTTPRMWLGPAGTITPLHIDASDNFAYQILGQKKWLLFSPKLYHLLKMYPPWAGEWNDFHVSKFDLRDKKVLEDLRDKNNIKPLEVILKPGDVLYVPRGWGHFVESLENSCLMNLWFNVDPITLKDAKRYTKRARKVD